jgi:hypothetical protein
MPSELAARMDAAAPQFSASAAAVDRAPSKREGRGCGNWASSSALLPLFDRSKS